MFIKLKELDGVGVGIEYKSVLISVDDISSIRKTGNRNGHRSYKESSMIVMKTNQDFFVKETIKEIEDTLKKGFPS